MIFITVGTQLPFDRLSRWVDELKLHELKDKKVFAQLGKLNYKPKHYEYIEDIAASKFSDLIADSDLVISHAGMGTIIECALKDKKLIVVPRLSIYKEHRNDHQLDTVDKFKTKNMKIANTKEELIDAIFGEWPRINESDQCRNKSTLAEYINTYLSMVEQKLNEIDYQHD